SHWGGVSVSRLVRAGFETRPYHVDRQGIRRINTMQRWRLWGCAAALVAAGVLGSALPGSAQKNKGGAKGDATIGYVDLALVTEQIKQTTDWKQNVSKFETERNKKRNEIEGLAKI